MFLLRLLSYCLTLFMLEIVIFSSLSRQQSTAANIGDVPESSLTDRVEPVPGSSFETVLARESRSSHA